MFYAVGIDNKGKNVVINNLPEDHLEATQAAVMHCKKNNIEFQGIYPQKKKQRQGGTTTKFNQYKKRYGDMPKEYYSAL